MADVLTGWTETATVPKKAGPRFQAASDARRTRFPCPIRGIDSDNAGEFARTTTSHSLAHGPVTTTTAGTWNKKTGRWCAAMLATCGTRARNRWLAERALRHAPPLHHFLSTSTKSRCGRASRRPYRRYNRARTPCQRPWPCRTSPERKAALQAQYEALNLAALRRDLLRLQNRLWDTVPTDGSIPEEATVL